jgi:SET domain-containing protein
MLRIDTTKDRGRGVFADAFIPRGTVLEEAPVIVIPPSQLQAIKSTLLFEYFFHWNVNGEDGCAICLGYGSIYNHSSAAANAHYVRLYSESKIRFVAIRDIHVGEEILTNYNGDTECRRIVWFEETRSKISSNPAAQSHRHRS